MTAQNEVALHPNFCNIDRTGRGGWELAEEGLGGEGTQWGGGRKGGRGDEGRKGGRWEMLFFPLIERGGCN